MLPKTGKGGHLADDNAENGRGGLKTFRNLMTFQLHMLGWQSERFSETYYRSMFGLSLPECRIIGITGRTERTTFKKVCEGAQAIYG